MNITVKTESANYNAVVDAFKELIERSKEKQQNLHQKVTISIGKKNGKGFLSYLKTSFKNPLVFIQNYNKEPQLCIRSFDRENGGSTILNLTMIENIEVKENCVGTDFLTYEITFHYVPADLDYLISVAVK